MSSTNRGFTIVELLIVIVVIAILATISVVSYLGIQQRANSTSRVSEMKAYANALTIYAADKGAFPINGTTVRSRDDGPQYGSYCLGTGFPDISWSGDSRPDCAEWWESDTATYSSGPNAGSYRKLHPNDDLNNALFQYVKISPGPRTGPLGGNPPIGNGYIGPWVTFWSTRLAIVYNYVPLDACPKGTDTQAPADISANGTAILCSMTIRL